MNRASVRARTMPNISLLSLSIEYWALTYLNSFGIIVLLFAVSLFVEVELLLPALCTFRSLSDLRLNGDMLGENVVFGVCDSCDGDADRRLSETLLLDLRTKQTKQTKRMKQ